MSFIRLLLLTVLLCLTFTAIADFKSILLLANQGDSTAQNNLGYMYSKGEGVPQSYEEAIRWYRLAADQGDAFAQYNLGYMYIKGEGVPQSYEEAIRWYRLAADQGFEYAQKQLNLFNDNKSIKAKYPAPNNDPLNIRD